MATDIYARAAISPTATQSYHTALAAWVAQYRRAVTSAAEAERLARLRDQSARRHDGHR